MDVRTISKHWKSQDEARAIVAEHGCKVCGWKLPGEIYDVTGDLWCWHCVEEFLGLRPGLPAQGEFAPGELARIP